MWTKGPNYALSLEESGYVFLCGRNIFYTILQLKGMWRDCCLTPDTEIRKILLSAAFIPNVGSLSYQLKRTRQNWEGYNYGWLPTYNPILGRKSLGHTFARAFLPWVEVAKIKQNKTICNLSKVMSTTFNASVQGFAYQQTQIHSLVEVVL